MAHITQLLISLRLGTEDGIEEAVDGLPNYCASSFQNIEGNLWQGEFIVSCPVAPELAEGDFVDDLAPHFPALLRMKSLYEASFAFEIAVGSPAADTFKLHGYSVAILAALGASITVRRNGSTEI